MRRPAALLSLVASLVFAWPAAAQQPDDLRVLKQEIEALKQEQAKQRGEIRALREQLLRSRATTIGRQQPENVALTLGGDPTKGDRSAKLVLVEFTDYQ